MKRTLLIICLLAVSAQSRQLYVRQAGNNVNAGTSIAASWATIGHACTTAVAGDTVNIGGGVWSTKISNRWDSQGAILAPIHSGSASQKIVFRSNPDSLPSGRAIIDGDYSNSSLKCYGISAYQVKNIIFEYLEVRRCWHFNVLVGYSDSITVQYVSSHHLQSMNNENGCGVTLYGATSAPPFYFNNVIKACTLYENYSEVANDVNTGAIETYAQNGALIEYNVCYGGDSTIGGNLYDYPNGIHLKAHTINTTVRYNRVYDFPFNEGIVIHHAGINDSVYGNLVWNCGAGILVSSDGRAGNEADSTYNIYYFNNTIYGTTGSGLNVGEFLTSSYKYVRNFNSWNNIVIGNNRVLDVVNYLSTFGCLDYNCYVSLNQPSTPIYWKGSYMSLTTHQTSAHYDMSGRYLDSNSVTISPYVSPFVDTAAHDFRLDTLTAPQALLTGGRPGYLPYMGAFNPDTSYVPPHDTTFTISGTITRNDSALAGVAILGTTTNGSGYYTVTHDSAWSGTATPVLTDNTFSPTHRDYILASNQSNQDYEATYNPSTKGERILKLRR